MSVISNTTNPLNIRCPTMERKKYQRETETDSTHCCCCCCCYFVFSFQGFFPELSVFLFLLLLSFLMKPMLVSKLPPCKVEEIINLKVHFILSKSRLFDQQFHFLSNCVFFFLTLYRAVSHSHNLTFFNKQYSTFLLKYMCKLIQF